MAQMDFEGNLDLFEVFLALYPFAIDGFIYKKALQLIQQKKALLV